MTLICQAVFLSKQSYV